MIVVVLAGGKVTRSWVEKTDRGKFSCVSECDESKDGGEKRCLFVSETIGVAITWKVCV